MNYIKFHGTTKEPVSFTQSFDQERFLHFAKQGNSKETPPLCKHDKFIVCSPVHGSILYLAELINYRPEIDWSQPYPFKYTINNLTPEFGSRWANYKFDYKKWQ